MNNTTTTTPARTRFAPSPTGFLHIGGFRTAFYAWLLAKKTGGQFLLRIEDTDRARTVPGAVKYLLKELAWFNVIPDEGPSREDLRAIGEDFEDAPVLGSEYGPYVQSQRLHLYKEIAEKLITMGAAYRCDCTSEMLERERLEQMARKEQPGYSGFCRDRNVSADVPHVIRFKMPHKKTVVLQDAVRGRVQWDNVSLRDTVLFKSDGSATYHLASVVDDHLMKITHVMRGEEWLATTPLHILLYETLGWEQPIFAHLSTVKGNDGKKLSKRHGATSVEAFRAEGYLPEALLNYSVLVGWSPGEGDNQEIFTREELFKKFSLDHINEASAVFDYNKLAWVNSVYIKNLSAEEFADRSTPFIERGRADENGEYTAPALRIDRQKLIFIAPFVQERVRTLAEVRDMVDFLFTDEINRNTDEMFKKGVDQTSARQMLEQSRTALSTIEIFEKEQIENALRGISDALGLKAGPAFGVIRIAVTGKSVTPPLFESLVCLGREKTLSRIDETLAALS